MTLARKVADYGHEQSLMLVAEQDLTSVNLASAPFNWDIEAGYNYDVRISQVKGWAGLSTDTFLTFNVEEAGGVIAGATDYRYGGVRTNSTGQVLVNGWTGLTQIRLCGLLDSANFGVFSNIIVNARVADSRDLSVQIDQQGYIWTAGEANYMERLSGYVLDGVGSRVVTKGRISSNVSGILAGGYIQVFRTPKAGA